MVVLLLLLVVLVVLAPAWISAAECDGGVQLEALLATSGLRQQLEECTAPLLLVPFKWTAGDATAYCEQDACKQALAVLDQLPSCTWAAVSTVRSAGDGAAERMARQVHGDCGAAA